MPVRKVTLIFPLLIAGLLAFTWRLAHQSQVQAAPRQAIQAAFYLTAHNPITNALGTAVDSNITATFDADVATGSVVSSSFAAHTQFSGLLTGTLSVAGDTITLNPARDLFAGERVQVIATAGISSTGGMSLTNPTQWGFTAGPVTNRCAGGFTDIGAGLTGVRLSSVAWGDYDNDGDLDILLTGDLTGGSQVAEMYRNDAGTFTIINGTGLIGTGVLRSSVAWGDYDNDGDLDILLTGQPFSYDNNSGVAKVYRNDAGTFTDINAGLSDVRLSSVAWGDYDNDGDLDILLTGAGSSRVAKVYRNDDGTFSDISAGLTPVQQSDVAWGDYDNDGDLDILLTGLDSGNNYVAKVYRNDAGTFSDISAGLTGVRASSVAWGDYDNDGDLDILLTGQGSDANGVAKVYRNDAGTFNDISAGLTEVQQSRVAWGDYDNDGDLDILLTGQDDASNRVTKVYQNDGGTFNDISAGLTGVWRGSVAWGDYDNDGDLDILLTGEDGGDNRVTRIYRNDDYCAPDVQLSKTVSSATAVPSDTITYTLAFSNRGTLTATHVVLTDAIPSDLSVTSVVSSGVAMTQTNTGNSYQWQIADLGADEGGTITIAGTLVPTATTFTNTATITTTDDLNPSNNIGMATVTVLFPDVQLNKAVSPATALPGDPITYTLDFSNSGGVTATNVILIDAIPSDLSVTSVVSSGAAITQTNTGNSYQWQIADLGAGEGGVITIVGTIVPTATAFINTATITTTDDFDPSNNTGSASVNLVDLSVDKSAVTDANGNITYTISVANSGNITTTTTITDEFPAEITNVSCTPLAYGTLTSANLGPAVVNGVTPVVLSYDTTGMLPAGATLVSVATHVDGRTTNGSWVSEVDLRVDSPSGLVFDVDFGDDLGHPDTANTPYDENLGPAPASGPAEGVYTLTVDEDFDDMGGNDNQIDNATITIVYVYPSAAPAPGDLMVTVDIAGSAGVGYQCVGSLAGGITVEKTPDTQDVVEGIGNAEFTVNIANTTGMTLTVDTSDPLVAACDNTLNVGAAGASYSCTDVNPASSYTNTIIATANIDVTNVVSVTAAEINGTLTATSADTIGTTASDTAFVNVIPPSVDLAVDKNVDSSTALPGDTITYTLAFSNSGTLTATHVVVSDVVPSQVIVINTLYSGVAMTQTNTSNSYQWQTADLAIGEGGTITIVGTLVPTATTFTNTATITTSVSDGDPSNNIGSAVVTVPSQHCNLQQGENYTFYEATVPVSVTINTVGDIHCLSIIRVDSTHVSATANMTDNRYLDDYGNNQHGATCFDL